MPLKRNIFQNTNSAENKRICLNVTQPHVQEEHGDVSFKQKEKRASGPCPIFFSAPLPPVGSSDPAGQEGGVQTW